MSEIAKHWIDGEWVGSGTVSESVNPATGAVLGQWADGGEAEARAAVAAGRRAFDTSPWSRDRALRHRALNEMADRFDAHAEELGTLVTKENGKKIGEGLFEGTSPSPTLRHNAAQALTEVGISAEVAPGQWFSTYAEPAGVVGIIVPWNSPVALLIRSLAPALSAGNTVAVKMPGQTALVANLVSQIIAEVTSLPRGVVNIFTESGNTGAPYLVAAPDVQVISYTGSTTVGRIVAANGAPTLKRMNLELGGKTPMIVFDDADLDTTVPLLAAGITTFAGEFCMTGSRILVQRGVADKVRTRLAGLLENVRVGDGMDPETDMGPLIDKADVARVDGMVQAALAYAKPVVRGGPATDGALAAGSFYRPALLEVEDVNTDIVQKEVFGPVATFEVFDTETDAIARANATEFGLAAGIFTSNINISRRVSRELHAGTIWTNTWAAINDGFAEGGYKQSGIGRLRGPLAITEFQEAKTVVHSIPPSQS
ncbi:MAG TPA: aldehyde dehydrogenase family protein [Streptosporangiaceae bacterium]|nr:aldehyde dehydrogenase family protein [Streptosporangiaceae bacterium]